MRYVFRAHLLNGAPDQGVVEATSPANARRSLASQGKVVYYLEEMEEEIAPPPPVPWWREIEPKALWAVGLLVAVLLGWLGYIGYCRTHLPAPVELILEGGISTLAVAKPAIAPTSTPNVSATPAGPPLRPRIGLTVCFPKEQLYIYSNGSSAIKDSEGVLQARTDPQCSCKITYRNGRRRYRLVARFTPPPDFDPDSCTVTIRSRGMLPVRFSPVRLQANGDTLQGMVPRARLIRARAHRPPFSERL